VDGGAKIDDRTFLLQSEAEPADWQRHVNGVLRYYMETSAR
jgi:hypothetical protein